MKKFLPPAVVLAWLASLLPGFAFAADEGYAKPWQLNFQTPATPVMEKLYDMHGFLLFLITAITLFVLLVMIYICLRFRRKANPIPSKTTHNTMLEVLWTTIPILILVIIAIPSLRVHYYMQHVVDPEMTLKITGYQWYWHYDYPDQGGFGFDSYIKKGNDLKEGDHRLLAVDNRVVVPVDTAVRVLITGADVIHAWAMPAFGVKRDAVPGRLNESWFKAEKTGTFYGQCSELCGVGHGFMPIVVDVVSKDEFKAWAEKKKAEAGIASTPAAPAEKVEKKAPLAKPETSKDVNPAPRAAKEERSQKTGEGKPSVEVPVRSDVEEKEQRDEDNTSNSENTEKEEGQEQ